MTTLRLFHHDDPAERETEELLPWYLNGSLEATERTRVEAHLAQCPRCRRQAEWLRDLQAAVNAEEPGAEVASALSRARAMIDELESASRWRAAAARALRGFRSAQPWLRWTVLGQGALIVVLAAGLALIGPVEPALYRTLAAPADAAAAANTRLSVVFDGDARVHDVRRVLAAQGARIVAGPSAAGAYTIEVTAASEQEALRRLRADGAVRLVERLPAESAQ